MSGRRRLALIAAAAGVALIGFLVARRASLGPQAPARSESQPAGALPGSSAAAAPVAAEAVPALRPAAAPSWPQPPSAAPAALSPAGTARALEAIGKNQQTRQLFERLQPLGLSRQQLDRVLLILGTQALRPAQESPTLEALRASGSSRVLSDREAKRVRDERQQIADRALRSLRPALAAVLTPAQLAQAGLGGDDPASAGARKLNIP